MKRSKNVKKQVKKQKTKPASKRHRQYKKPAARKNTRNIKPDTKRPTKKSRLALSLYKEFLKYEKTKIQHKLTKKPKPISTKNSSKKKQKSNTRGLAVRERKSKFNIYRVKDQTFEERLNYELELYNKDKIDLANIQNQNPEELFNLLKKFADRLYNKLNEPTQHFSILIKYFEGTYTGKRKGWTRPDEFDAVSTPVRIFEDMPDNMYQELEKLINLFLKKINEYKKYQANFILESISIQIFNNEKEI